MRLSTDEDRDEELALDTIAAAVDAGVTVLDTARAYGQGENELGHNERLLARALRRSGAEGRARTVTKGGMTRTGGGWIPDGRAKAIRGDCEASLVALEGLEIDLYLIHAPDPRTPWRTSVRALARLLDDGLVRHIGLSNVNRGQLDEALELAPITAVQVALNPFDEHALRGGVVDRCVETGVTVIAHSPLGGPRRVGRLARNDVLADVAAALDATPAEAALAWVLDLAPGVVAIPGARRPESARSAARAATLALEPDGRATLTRAFFGERSPAQPPPRADDAEVVLVMGIPGAGKTRLADDYVARGYVRLNRDERGGSLREIAAELDEQLASGARRLVLDNTYLTRASRSYVIETASRHGVGTRCVWLETPLAQAQVNMVERLLDRVGSLPPPDELRALARRHPDMHAPTTQMRTQRELEPPSDDEGFALVERVPFERARRDGRDGVLFAAAALRDPEWTYPLGDADRDTPHLVFDWLPDGTPDALAADIARLSTDVSAPIESALCPHPGGPPTCWCRPPLPGLALAFARAHNVDLSRSVVVGTGPAHRTLASTLGAGYVQA